MSADSRDDRFQQFTLSTRPPASSMRDKIIRLTHSNGVDSLQWSDGLFWRPLFDNRSDGTSYTADVTITTQACVGVDATGGALNVFLPAVPEQGMNITVFKRDASANVVTVQRQGTALINGATSKAITATQWAGLTFFPDGANWYAK
jgi:hypothetical protein